MNLILSFIPSAAPLETRWLVHERRPSRWVRSVRTNLFKGSRRELGLRPEVARFVVGERRPGRGSSGPFFTKEMGNRRCRTLACMDMWAVYANLVREHAANEQILLTGSMSSRTTFKETRWLPLKNPWNLTGDRKRTAIDTGPLERPSSAPAISKSLPTVLWLQTTKAGQDRLE